MKTLLALPGLHWIASRFGWSKLRAASFDAKFRAGHWGGDDPELSNLIREHNPRTVALLGCGTAGALCNLYPHTWAVGVDLSPVAVELARKRHRAATFRVADMRTWSPWFNCDIICFPESIYYLDRHEIVPLLNKFVLRLNPCGMFVVSLSEGERWSWIETLIRQEFLVLRRIENSRTGRRILVFTR